MPGASASTPGVRNSVSVESPYGLRSFTLILGDIAASPDPVLVVPTHAYARVPVTGQVVDAIEHRYGVDFGSLEPLLVPREGFGTYRVGNRGKFPGREILLVRIPGSRAFEEDEKEGLSAYRRALWTLFGSLAALELRDEDLRSLALPLLAGTRGYEIRGLMRTILEHSLAWLKASRFMNAVNLYLLDDTTVEAWAAAMDDVLGRKFVDTAQNELIRALRDEILARLRSGELASLPDSWRYCLDGLHQTLQQQRIPLDRVAAEGRRLVECMVESLLRDQGMAQPNGNLFQQIGELRRRNQTAPWIISHFDCLRIFGNEAVHLSEQVSYRPPAFAMKTWLLSWHHSNGFWRSPRRKTDLQEPVGHPVTIDQVAHNSIGGCIERARASYSSVTTFVGIDIAPAAGRRQECVIGRFTGSAPSTPGSCGPNRRDEGEILAVPREHARFTRCSHLLNNAEEVRNPTYINRISFLGHLDHPIFVGRPILSWSSPESREHVLSI